ncbi:hypothetical protein FOMPIDRAFT_94372 [Fomitopsis schrenkii]|uniref:Uncharacterized protein n=1 Tax=Fomitopsis schrenkii TaxID=2126942 RepID=S8DVX5_FOMSC|nr:hypothetical protein FOMPIDRAFT_94372 [Fomitopsis schrenkii]
MKRHMRRRRVSAGSVVSTDKVLELLNSSRAAGTVGDITPGSACWTKRNYTAAVKAITSGRGICARSRRRRKSRYKKLFGTHGYPIDMVMVHVYPSMKHAAEIRDTHDSRVLYSAISDIVFTGAGNKNLKF